MSRLQTITTSVEKVVEESDTADIAYEPGEYLSTLRKQKANAFKLINDEVASRKKIIEQLPTNERILMEREAKVLSTWHERQVKWDSIRDNIQTKVHGKKAFQKDLLMESIDNYRPKAEEYDIMQAAKPEREWFHADLWSSSLREGQRSRFVTIGNMYSGLECEIDKPRLPPITVRKPSSNVQRSGSLFDSSTTRSIELRKEIISKDIEKIRPYTLDSDNVDSLLIRSTDLFDWAIESSQEYFNQIRPELQPIAENDGNITERADEDDIARAVSAAPSLPDILIECLRFSDINFACDSGKFANQFVNFKNTGTVAIEYRWERKSPSDDSSLLSRIKNKDISVREFLLKEHRRHFICSGASGTILPGETVKSQFIFKGVLGGIFTEEWTLVCTPPAQFTFTPQFSGNNGPKEERISEYTSELIINLHGHCIEVDESSSSRSEVCESIDQGVVRGFVEDILNECLSRVRYPVTLAHIHQREKDYFIQTNSKFMSSQLDINLVQFPLFVTTQRISEVRSLCMDIVEYRCSVARRYLFLKKMSALSNESLGVQDITSNNISLFDNDDFAYISLIRASHLDRDLLVNIQAVLFPEKVLESFDNVDRREITPTWDYSLERSMQGIDSTIQIAKEINAMEISLHKRIKNNEKSLKQLAKLEAKRLKELRRAQKAKKQESDDEDDDEDENEQEDQVLPDSDGDEDEEENEEEVEIEEEANLTLNDWEHQTLLMKSLLIDKIRSFYLPTYPRSSLFSLVQPIMAEKLANFEEWKEKSSNESGIVPPSKETSKSSKASQPEIEVIYERFKSPFVSDEGKEDWKVALTSPLAFDKKKKGSIGLTPLATTGSSKASKSTPQTLVASKEQVGIYYHNMYNYVRDALIEAVDNMFTAVEKFESEKASEMIEQSGYSYDRMFDVPHILSSDMTSSVSEGSKTTNVVFVNFQGDWFLPSKEITLNSSFNVGSIEQKKAFGRIKKLGDSGANAIVLIYESYHERESLLKYACPILRSFILQSNEAAMALAPSDVKIIYELRPCLTLAELKYKLQTYGEFISQSTASVTLPQTNSKKSKKKVIPPVTVPIFILEDIRMDGVIPKTPEFRPDDEADDDVPIFIGEDASIATKRLEWYSSKEHKAVCHVVTESGSSVKLEVFTSPGAAIIDVYRTAESVFGKCVWVDDTLRVLYPKASVILPGEEYRREEILREQGLILSDCLSPLNKTRLCCQTIREAAVWLGVLLAVPSSMKYWKAVSTPPQSKDDIIAHQLQAMFPRVTLSSPRKLNAVAVLGGELRHDKLVSMFQLINLVDTIVVAGEIAVLFLAFNYNYQFIKYEYIIASYKELCIQITAKARMLGTKIIMPSDALFGDLPLCKEKLLSPRSPQASVPASFCDEGCDYEGDITLCKLSTSEELKVFDGYLYDFGNESVLNLRSVLLAADLVIAWGPVGACEYSPFQAGQRQLVESASQVAYQDRSNPAVMDRNKPSKIIVVGLSSVEWHSRIFDSEGEYGGDLMGVGVLAYSLRDSNVFSGMLGLCESKYINERAAMRCPTNTSDEWVFSSPPIEIDDE